MGDHIQRRLNIALIVVLVVCAAAAGVLAYTLASPERLRLSTQGPCGQYGSRFDSSFGIRGPSGDVPRFSMVFTIDFEPRTGFAVDGSHSDHVRGIWAHRLCFTAQSDSGAPETKLVFGCSNKSQTYTYSRRTSSLKVRSVCPSEQAFPLPLQSLQYRSTTTSGVVYATFLVPSVTSALPDSFAEPLVMVLTPIVAKPNNTYVIDGRIVLEPDCVAAFDGKRVCTQAR